MTATARHRWRGVVAIASLLVQSAPAQAADATSVDLSGSVSVVSEYISRGLRQTWGYPAIQGSVEVGTHGAYLGGFGSNVSPRYWAGGSMEWDLLAGYRPQFRLRGVDWSGDVGIAHYFYPGANCDRTSAQLGQYPSHSYDTTEAYAGLGAVGLSARVYVTLSDYYGYDSSTVPVVAWNSGVVGGVWPGNDTHGSTYVDLSWAAPRIHDFGVILHLGRQWVAHGDHLNYSDYRVAVDRSFGNWSADIAVSGTRGAGIYADFLSLDGGGSKSTIGATRLSVGLSRSF